MSNKSHFKFSNKQRNGIFLLAIIIVGLQCIYAFVDFSSKESVVDEDALVFFRKQIDSLKRAEADKVQAKSFSFNPNFISDYKGYTLGMSVDEIDRLLQFRKTEQWINSPEQFQQVTGVSDSLLAIIAPQFKFPEWIKDSKVSRQRDSKTNNSYQNTNKENYYKLDLNTATAKQLQQVNGIGEKLSERIIKYRNKFKGGFISEIQLQDIYGLSSEVIERLGLQFEVKTPREVERINLNIATRDQLVTIQHIDYEVAFHIIEYRTLREGFKTFDELLQVKKFPVEKFEIIKLYLSLN